MKEGVHHPSARQRRTRLAFGSHTLDLDRGCLFHHAMEIELRPKTFAVLRHLLENPGRLVSKDELFAAIWPDVIVTDDTLVQSVGELRRALGEEGPRLIRTIPRRGYRFEGTVIDRPPPGPTSNPGPFPDPLAVPPGTLPAAKSLGRRLPSSPAMAALVSDRGRIVIGLFAIAILAGLWAWSGAGPRDLPPASVSGPVSQRPTIAVMPFANRIGEASRDYFSDGVTQDLIQALGRFSGLTVLSWNAVLPFKGVAAAPHATLNALGVRYQVEGTVAWSGDRVRIAALLVAADGKVLWSNRFDEAMSDLFVLQDRIIIEIAGALAIRVTEAEQRRASAKPTANLQAYDHVLRSRPLLQRPSRAGLAEARALLRRAIELDPRYAAAHAALADTYYTSLSWGWAEEPMTFIDRAEAIANAALRIDDADVRATVVLGRIHLARGRHDLAEVQMQRAVALNPSDAQGLAGHGNVLMWAGDIDRAVAALELALKVDPELNAMDRFALSLAYYLQKNYDAAIEQARLTLRNSEGASFSYVVLAAASGQLGRSEDAARAAGELRRRDPTFDPETIATKLRSPAHLAHVQDGLRKAGI